MSYLFSLAVYMTAEDWEFCAREAITQLATWDYKTNLICGHCDRLVSTKAIWDG